MDFEFPVEALMVAVRGELSAAVAETETDATHLFGEEYRAAHGDCPRYVWVPGRTRDKNDTPTRQVEELRSLHVLREHFEVDCWGLTWAHAWALRTNLFVAMNRQAAIDVTPEGGEWVPSAHGHRGRCYRFEGSLMVPVIDGYVSYQALLVPEPSYVEIETIEADIYASPNVETDGERFLTVTTADP